MNIQETKPEAIKTSIEEKKVFFSSHKTKNIAFRLRQLNNLKNAILYYQPALENALYQDLKKSKEAAFLSEIGLVLNELNHHIKQLKKWAKPKQVSTPLFLFPSSSKIVHEPLGTALIIAPWNYPVQLTLSPLIGAISSGCCAIIKPSPDASATAIVLEEIIKETFAPNYISVIQGGIPTNTALLEERFDLIFFTGSTQVGKIVMKAATEHLTPVVLELGGKSPCIVDASAKLELAAKRIIWGKLLNAGQTCIAPDYILVHESIKTTLIEMLQKQVVELYGKELENSPYYSKIIHQSALERLTKLMPSEHAELHFGGASKADKLFIAPTVVEIKNVSEQVMQEEIFGPILPIIVYSDINETIDYINRNEKPLALYIFGNKKVAEHVIQQTSSGGVCVNDTLLHIANHHLPFGGVGQSGMGKYHGEASFQAFSNAKSILSTPTWIDLPFKYPPFKYFSWIKRLF